MTIEEAQKAANTAAKARGHRLPGGKWGREYHTDGIKRCRCGAYVAIQHGMSYRDEHGIPRYNNATFAGSALDRDCTFNAS